MKYTLFSYDLWFDFITCDNCGKEGGFDVCPRCGSNELSASYSVNDVYREDTIEAESLEEAEKLLGLKLENIELDNQVYNDNVFYYRYKTGKFSGSPACEIRIEKL